MPGFGRFIRRASVVTVVVLALGVGLPPALVPSGHGLVGWAALRDWLVAAPSWAKDPTVPQQQRGKGVDGHYVKAPTARDSESKHKVKGELAKYQAFQPTVTNKSTGPARKGFDAGTSKRVASMSDAKADVFQNADGSYTRRVYRNPVNFKAADGSWSPIDSQLRAGGDRRLESTANAFKVSFAPGTAKKVDAEGVELPPASGAAAAPVAEDLVRMTLSPGVELAYSLAGASLNMATVDRSVARYRNVYPGVDLELGAKASGTKENLVLHSADVPTQYVYPLKLKGLTPRLNAAGEVEFVTAAGAVGLTMPAGYMEDASNSHAGAGEISNGVRYELVQVDGGPAVKVSIDGAWLRDPQRKFPVVLDPQTRVVTQYDTYAISTDRTSPRNLEQTLAVGSWNGTEKARSFINFDGFPATMAGRRVGSARLHLFMTYQGDLDGNPCVARPYNVYPVTSAWNAATATWDNMPGYNTGKLMATDSPSSSLACTNSDHVRNRGVWSTPSLDTQTMVDWATVGGIYGLALTASETDHDAWKRFTSSDTSLICPSSFGNIECDPFIEVNYVDNVAPQLDYRYPANNTAVNTLTPELSAKGSDPDSYPNYGLRYKFFLYNDQGQPLAVNPSSPWTDGFWKVPAGTLTWGKTYLYQVQVDDRSSIGPTNPVPFAFSTAVPQQMVSSSLAQNGGKGFEGSVGNYTTNAVDAQIATVGPALSIARDYNSLDVRKSAFGQGWSTLVDMQVREGLDADNALQTAVIRYPNGQEVTFGRNNDGTWAPPPGRFSVFKQITGGYSLTDKDSTAYEFTKSAGTGLYGLTKITDSNGRALTVAYDSNGRAIELKSLSSNRKLTLAWSTPPGASVPHVATVTTDPSDPLVPTSTLTYTYSYTGDQLTKVCPPGTTTDCAKYEYQTVNQHNSTVLNTGPYSFWRLNDPVSAGTQAKSGVLSNDGIDNALYSNVTLEQPAALPNSTSKSAGFNGTNSSVKVPEKLANESSYQSISMWFKTTATTGVLFSYQKDLVTPGATTTASYNPALYIDNTGKLRGSLWMGNTSNVITSANAVNDGQWHHAALVGNGGSQQLYLDGALVPVSVAGTIQLHNTGMDKLYIGAGFLSNAWPGNTITTATATFFNGSIADVAYFNKPLTAQLVSSLYTSGKTPSGAMTKVTSNAGRVRAVIGYDAVSGRVNQVTDEVGGVWQVGQPTVSGSSQVYASAVLGSQPREYFRLNDITLPAGPKSQSATWHKAAFNNVTFDTTQPNTTSPFADSFGAGFNGTNSFIQYVIQDEDVAEGGTEGQTAVEMWFKIPAGYAKSSVLYEYQELPVDGPNPASIGWVPALYVGTDGYLRGQFWDGAVSPLKSSTVVNDGNWHHVVLSAEDVDSSGLDRQSLYLDNVLAGSRTGYLTYGAAKFAYIGAGTTKNWPATSPGDNSYFKGQIAEFAYYDHGLSTAQVDAHYKASKSALAPTGTTVLTPVSSVSLIDPDGKTSRKVYDLLNGGRLVGSTDTLGNTTSYGYDIGGFVNVVYDPVGQKTETAKDVRGNTVRTTTCRNEDAGQFCQDTLYKFWPDATTTNLTPDPRNDQLIEVVTPLASGYMGESKTTFTYDPVTGNRLSMTGPPVTGYPGGRTVSTEYTTATTPAVGSGFTPPGLPTKLTSARGAVQRTEYNSAGDVVRVTEPELPGGPAGLVTEFTYDGLGRLTQKKVLATGYPNGLITTYTYDGDGQLVQTTEPAVTNAVTGAVHTTRTVDVFDADDNVTSRTVSDLTGGDSPRVVTSAYNSYGQLVKSVDPVGVVTLYGYDVYGRQNSTVWCDTDPAVGSPCPTGDRLQVVNQVFDSEGRLLTSTTTGKDGTSVQETSNAYYANGSLASTTDAMGWTTKYEYYDDGNLKRTTRTDGTKTTVLRETTYDQAGNPWVSKTNNGATRTAYKVDNAGRIETQFNSTQDGVTRMTNFVYDADDHVTLTRNEAGTTTFQPLRDVRNTYDAMGRVTSERVSVNAAGAPVGWWELNGTAAPNSDFQAVDSSGSQHPMWGSTAGTGISMSGGFASFTGGDSISTEWPTVDTSQSYSMSAWVKVNNFTSTQTAVSQTGSNRGAFYLQYNKDWNRWVLQSPSADTTGAVSYNVATSSNALATNTWVHLVGVFDASTKRMSLYVNNVRGTDGTNATPFASVYGLEIGGSHWGDFVDHFQGSIDNVQVYQRALTDADVAKLWSAGNGRTADTVLTSTELTTSYTLDNRGLTTDMVDPNGNTTSYVYDEAGSLTKTVAPSVSTEVYNTTAVQTRPTTIVGYNAFGEPVEHQDPLGNVTQARYDAAGRVWKTIMPSYTPPGGAPIVDASSTVVYDKLGRTTSTTDPRNKTTSYEYDTLGNVTKVTGPTGKITTAKYDAVGDIIEAVDPTGAKTTATYDYLGRKLTSTQVVRQPTPVSNTTTYDYGTGVYGDENPAAGPWLRKVTSPGGVTAEMTYNTLGEVLTQKDGAGNVTSTVYDGLGRPVLVTNPDNTKASTVYDGAGRVVQTSQLDAANAVLTTRSATYDNNGNLATATDARGHTTTFTYSPLDQVVGEAQPVTSTLSTSTSFGYDAAGNRTRFTDGRGNQFWSTYNTWGLPESQIEPSTTAHTALADRKATNVYDLGGRLTSRQLQSGVQINYAYDDLGQVIGQTGSGTAVPTAARTFGYDDAGRITSLSVPGGTNTISYDDRGLPLSITGPADNTSYTYNSDGNLTTRTDAAGTTNFTYDTAGRLQTMANATTNINLSVAYNTLNQPKTVTYGINNKKRTFEYDTLHRLKTDTVTSFDGSVIQGSIAYGYDNNSNLTSKVTTGFAGASSNTYTYDWADRLQTWTTGSTTTNYSYDASGNRTQNGSKTFTYDQRNRLTGQSGGISYSYTGRGTLKQVSGPSGVYDTAADAYGQVITQGSASGTITYAYDALGRAVKPGFKYSGLTNDLADDGTTKYTRDPGGGLLAAGTGTGANSKYVWTDLHTDVVGQFTATGSSLTGSASYDPLGVVLASTGLVGSLGYQSEFTEQATGRVNMHARWYNTDTGQFDTRDTANNSPVPASISANRYQYGGGNPLTNTDPTGHSFLSSLRSSVSSGWNTVTSAVNNTMTAASNSWNYVASGQAWQDARKAADWVVAKAESVRKQVAASTTDWAKKKVQSVRDKLDAVKKCVNGGVKKCATDTVKAAKKYAEDTINTIKEDPWKFVATAAVGIAAAVAVGALCATGVGCLILAGAVAGAMAAGAGYMIDVGRGDAEFSWGGLADTMIQGGLDGGFSAGMDKLTGGAGRWAGGRGGGGGRGGLPSASRPGGGGGGLPSASRPGGGGGGLPSASRPGGGGGGHPAAGRPSTSGSGGGAPRAGGGGGAGASNGHRGGSAGGSGSGCSCACPGKRHSFDPFTLVLLADGSSKAIKDVRPGDEVVAVDPTTRESKTEIVEALHHNDDTDLTDLVVTIEHGADDEVATVKTTWHHPFWNDVTAAWVDAQDLKVGDQLRTADGSLATVSSVRNYAAEAEMFDLTVSEIHTYSILVGDVPVVVHNYNCGDGDDDDFRPAPAVDSEIHGPRQLSSRGVEIPPGVQRLPSGRLPANFSQAGRTFEGETWTPDLQNRFPNGVRMTNAGYPDFSPYAVEQVVFGGDGFAGNTTTDFTDADRMAGMTGRRPRGWTWHHHEDGRTMQLILTEVHNGVRHAGGRALARRW
ncbi:LamG-like jellyroll fold domain-containing protein [Dactylosporangium sp. NPDC000521]|uniref:LamG-like jellyroll fold domain-containing protein n=1 Tax=Dactylosporangium sp. NPDC000521 TaxID=3363975 RepID=UPI003699D82E